MPPPVRQPPDYTGRRRAASTRADVARRRARTSTESASTPAGPALSSRLRDDFADIAQERIAVHDRRVRVLDDPLLADHSLAIDEKERPGRGHPSLVEDSVGSDDLPVGKVAEQRIGQLEGFRERLLGEGRVGTDREDLDTKGFEALVVGLPGRQVRGSGGRKVIAVELQKHEALSLEFAE